MTQYLSLITIISSLLLMTVGVIIDLKDKRFPNYLFISLLMIGIGYSAITNGLSNLYKPIGLFILFTVCGIVFHKIRLVAPGDMKFFSLFAFYLSWSINESITFILFLLLYSILNLAIFIYKREHSIKAIFDSIRTQLIEFKIYYLSHIRISKDYTEIEKQDGIAFTLPLFLSFLSVFILLKIGLL